MRLNRPGRDGLLDLSTVGVRRSIIGSLAGAGCGCGPVSTGRSRLRKSPAERSPSVGSGAGLVKLGSSRPEYGDLDFGGFSADGIGAAIFSGFGGVALGAGGVLAPGAGSVMVMTSPLSSALIS